MNAKIKVLIIMLLTMFSVTECLAADVYLYLTRHGKTMFNTVHRAQGWADTPLTSEGVEGAQKLGRGVQSVKFIAAWSSDAGRARETAQLVMQGWKKPLPLQESRGLREINFGLFEGDLDENMWGAAAKQVGYPSQAALMTAFSDRKIDLDQMIDAIKSAEAQGTEALKGIKSTGAAESYRQAATRLTRTITDIAQQAQRQGGGNVLVVSHGLAIMVLLKELGETSVNHGLSNAGVTKIRYTDAGKFVIESIDDLSYVQNGS
ncbi:histidine phosphatase family protein [Erwinia pyri]|uniref:Histidine phosphatase family protein n=1 Tax=Erwinia pyri TaxID=3062598 RepID=A0AA50DNV2_9GAMM|nr:histidine phosphatase family protein [Erwinia sp. DE2]WLS79470.1 histidine phosphatase family protein [Erwinia sp. DE2]